MPAVNITTTAAKAFEIPSGSWGYRMHNASDETIYTLDNAAVTVATGMPLAAGAERTVCFAERSRQPMSVQAIHAGSGNKSLRYEILTVQLQAASRTSPSGGAGSFGSLTGAPGDNAALAAALAAKLDKAGGTMTGALTISTTGTGLTVGSGAAGSSIGIRGTGTTLLMTVGFGDSVSIGGHVIATGGLSMSGGSLLGRNASAGVYMASAGQIGFGSSGDNTGTNDAFLVRAAAASLQLGANHATTPTAQTIKSHNVTTGTGADLVLTGGTGSVNGGMVKLSNASGDVRMSVGDDGIGFFSSAPQPQITTAISGAVFSAGASSTVTDDSTFDGYTISQIVAGLRSFGLFA